MPQATTELQNRWGGLNGIGDDKAIAFLEGRGFRMEHFCWKRPHPGYEISEEEWSAIDFLIQEWDYGSIIDDPQPQNERTEGK